MTQEEPIALPEGWTRHGLSTQVFYYHQATNTTSVELPVINGSGAQVNQHHPVGIDNFATSAPNATQALTPATEPLLPTADPADVRASKRGWRCYILSLACCCFCNGIALVFSPVVWLITACKYLRKTPQERGRFPKQRAVAFTSLTTCFCASSCVFLVIAVGIGFGAGFVFATQSKIVADLEMVGGHCANVSVYEKAACPDGFVSCERWPTQSERDNICADISNGTCAVAVKERGVNDVFDLVCDARTWPLIQKKLEHHRPHFMHHGHHGHHRHFNPVILYVSKNRAVQYMKKWCPKHRKRHSKHHEDSDDDYNNYNYYYYHEEYQGVEEWKKVEEPHKGFSKRWFQTKWFHTGQHNEFQV